MARITEHVSVSMTRPGRVLGKQLKPLELRAERFAGVLKHPVPMIEMARMFDIERPAWKVVAEWDPDRRASYPIEAGDQLEIDGTTYSILGVRQFPRCFLEIYIDAPW